jgi:homoserine dehydrogenase
MPCRAGDGAGAGRAALINALPYLDRRCMEPIKVGLLGFGTVGSGTFTVLRRNQEEIKRRAGRGIEVARVAVRNPAKALAALGEAAGSTQVGNDFNAVVDDPGIGIVAEMIGGTGLARELVLRAIKNGKHVVTANKALLAVHGTEIFAAAHAKGVMVAFEAAVAGGIPIIKALREGLTANRIQYIAGIINGTTNYILSEMRERGVDFATALAGAQALGYAESDPTFDIEGIDAAHKLTIMSAIAFGVPMQFDRAYVEGISKLDATDIKYAEDLGYRIKLLGITRRTERGIELRVHPTLISAKRLLASVEGAMNAVEVHGDAVGASLYYGKGAGAEPTASAVVADLVDVTRLHTADPEHRVPHLAFQPESLSDTPMLPIDEVTSGYYLRLRVADVTGVLADITRLLADAGISIGAMLQRESENIAADGETDVVLIAHETLEKNVNAAIVRIEALATVVSKVTKLRIEALN